MAREVVKKENLQSDKAGGGVSRWAESAALMLTQVECGWSFAGTSAKGREASPIGSEVALLSRFCRDRACVESRSLVVQNTKDEYCHRFL